MSFEGLHSFVLGLPIRAFCFVLFISIYLRVQRRLSAALLLLRRASISSPCGVLERFSLDALFQSLFGRGTLLGRNVVRRPAN